MALRLLNPTRTATALAQLSRAPLGVRSTSLRSPLALARFPTTPFSPVSKSTTLAAFHSASIRAFQATPAANGALPETVPIHEPNHMEGSYHWDFERALSIALVPIISAQAIYGAHPITDLLVGVVLPLHCHVGWDAMVTDYVHKRKYPKLSPLCSWSLRVFTVLTLVGCYQFNTNDIGLTELIKRTWKA